MVGEVANAFTRALAEGVDGAAPCGRTERVSHTDHSSFLFLPEEKEKNKDKNVVTSTVQIYAISK